MAVLYHATTQKESFERSGLINALSEKDRNLLYEMIWQCSDCPQTNDPKWGENNSLEVDKKIFNIAVEELIIAKYERSDEKSQIGGKVWILAGNPGTSDKEWGKNYALINLELLADAMQ